MTNTNDENTQGRYGEWRPEIDPLVRQLEQIVPALWDKLWNEGDSQHFFAENCLYMLDLFMDCTIDDSESWRRFLSRLSWLSGEIGVGSAPEEFEKVLTAIHETVEAGGEVSQPVRVSEEFG